MSFEELLKEIKRTSGDHFPEAALLQLPLVVSPKVQKRILTSGKSTEELAEIFLRAFRQIDYGSVEKVEDLIEKTLTQNI